MAGPGWFVWGGLMPSFSVFSRVQGSTSMYVCMYGECVCTEKVWGKRGTVGQGLPFVSSCFTFLQASSLCASLHRARLVSLWPDSTACSLLMWHVLRRATPWSWASLSQRMVSELSLINAIPAHACVTHLPTLHVAALHQAAGPTIYFALSLSLSHFSPLASRLCLASGSCCLCCSHSSSSSSSHTRGTITIRRQCLCASLPLVWSPSP
ncbi:hypothetical protein CPAR01_16684 [Colletotrichum paranaense]|uniref:Secreted protein n=1 Tax=Colletotrichum paranaense TaxID=1914294 RepID=A0ABQ9RVL5_9PEZI|nr:uncharacterized protein CPAR01_16684 [Colletotrichum paranaense]KAK1515563.1 hypothetical protein CPAR01_16684 [Colletotrichum paranaense]